MSLPSEPAPYTAPGGAAASPKKTKAIVSVVLGGIGVLFAFIVPIIGIGLGVAAVILGFIAPKSEPAAGKLPLVGKILGFVAVGLSIVLIILAAVALTAVMQQQGM